MDELPLGELKDIPGHWRQAGDQLQRRHQRLQGVRVLAGADSAEGRGNQRVHSHTSHRFQRRQR